MNKKENDQLTILNQFWVETYNDLKQQIQDIEQWNASLEGKIDRLEQKLEALQ